MSIINLYFYIDKVIMQKKININYGKEALVKLPKKLFEKQYSSVFVLVDINTQKYCLPNFIEKTGLDQIELLVMEAGEEHKNLKTCENLWYQLSELGADRNSILINLGGGVVTDLGGFVACTFKRGIDFYNVPTSLLSMVDASIGGKTGIDLGPLKNQIGIIEEPKHVIIDPEWLRTLPKEEIRSGFAEMLKHGIIANVSYWEKLKNISSLERSLVSKFIKSSINIKKNVILKDPKEKNLRKILNFGHTLGHAIESYFLSNPKKSRLLHGDAIAIGMVLESFLSVHCCKFPLTAAKDIKKTFARFYPKVHLDSEDRRGILKLLRFDKKNKKGKIKFVLLKGLEIPIINMEVPEELFNQAFDFYTDF